MKLAVVKYNAGNIRSVIYALNRLGIDPVFTDDHEELRSADKVLFPGVGEASSAMRHLKEAGLDVFLPTLKQPFFGICIGQQLMCKHSEEGDAKCMGVFDVDVKKFKPSAGHKVPHMGWNNIGDLQSPLFKGVEATDQVYFVHSYYSEKTTGTIATCDYTLPFSAGLQKDNFYAVQFHPEKSGLVGEKILKNFLDL